jgi:hypothetical protein
MRGNAIDDPVSGPARGDIETKGSLSIGCEMGGSTGVGGICSVMSLRSCFFFLFLFFFCYLDVGWLVNDDDDHNDVVVGCVCNRVRTVLPAVTSWINDIEQAKQWTLNLSFSLKGLDTHLAVVKPD